MTTVSQNKTFLQTNTSKIILTVFVSLVCAFFLFLAHPTSAFADPGLGGGGEMGEETGGSNGGGNGNGEAPRPPKPPSRSDGQVSGAPQNVLSFTVDCGSWDGVGWYVPGSNCHTNGQNVISAPGNTGPRQSYRGDNLTGAGGTSGAVCGPNGSMAAYAQTWTKIKIDIFARTIDYWWDPTTKAWRSYPITNLIGADILYNHTGCNYPVIRTENRSCFWNFGGYSRYSIDRTANTNAWSHFANRTPLASDPGAPSGGSGNTPPSGYCTSGATSYVYVQYTQKPDKLGYYQMNVSYNYRIYTRTSWNRPDNGAELYSAGWTASGVLSNGSSGYWVYSCRPGGENNALEGRFPNQGSIPDRTTYLNPATCPQVTWQCVLDSPTTIGLERNAVIAGTVNPNTAASVMRNGQKVNIDFARVRVIDTSTPNDIDVTNGQTGPSIRNVTNIGYQTNVKNGSTPFFGTDPNSSSQYFKYYTNRSANTKEKFGQWLSNNNLNLDKSISFNWASESSAQAFQLQRNYRVTAEFYIPGPPDMSNSGSPSGSSSYVWKTGTYDCRQYVGRGQNRTDVGPLISTSNPVDVVRSTNK